MTDVTDVMCCLLPSNHSCHQSGMTPGKMEQAEALLCLSSAEKINPIALSSDIIVVVVYLFAVYITKTRLPRCRKLKRVLGIRTGAVAHSLSLDGAMTTVATQAELCSVLDGLPPVQHAFGYGSGVMPQPLESKKYSGRNETGGGEAQRAGSVVDFVFAVDSPLEWHAENMALNPHHYAGHLRMLG